MGVAIDLETAEQAEIAAETIKNVFRVKTGDLDDSRRVLEMAVSMGWTIGQNDAEIFFSADPNGFFVGMLDGELVGACRTIKYSPSFGFVGLYIVDPKYQGKGFGSRIWQAGMKYLSDCATIGLDALPGRESLYARAGFAPAYSYLRYSINCAGSLENIGSGTVNLAVDDSAKGAGNPLELVDVTSISSKDLAAYDSTVFPGCRKVLIDKVANSLCSIVVGAVSRKTPTKFRAYGVLRKMGESFCIGPLFADCAESAQLIFNHLTKQVPENSKLLIDVPDCNQCALDMVHRHGFDVVLRRVRMYTNGKPAGECTSQVYAGTKYKIG